MHHQLKQLRKLGQVGTVAAITVALLTEGGGEMAGIFGLLLSVGLIVVATRLQSHFENPTR